MRVFKPRIQKVHTIRIFKPFPNPADPIRVMAETRVSCNGPTFESAPYDSIEIQYSGTRSIQLYLPSDRNSFRWSKQTPPLFYEILNHDTKEEAHQTCITDGHSQLRYIDILIDYFESPDLPTPRPLWLPVVGFGGSILAVALVAFHYAAPHINISPNLSYLLSALSAVAGSVLAKPIWRAGWTFANSESQEAILIALKEYHHFLRVRNLRP